MPYNGAGRFDLYTPGNPVVTGTTISSTWANNTLSDIATGLSTAVTKNGQTTVTANIPFGGYKLTGIGSGNLTIPDSYAATATAGVGDALIGFKQSNSAGIFANAEALTVHQKLQQIVSVDDFIPSGTNTATTDCSTYINNALSAGSNIVLMSGKTYRSTASAISVPSSCELHGVAMGFGVYSSTVIEYTGTGIAIDIAGYYAKLYGITVKQAGTGTIGVRCTTTQFEMERVTIVPNASTGFSTAGYQGDTSATTFTHLFTRCYIYGNAVGFDFARGNNFVVDKCYVESNGTNIRVGNSARVVNLCITNGTVLELFGDGRAAESLTGVNVDVIDCYTFVCRDSYFEVNGTSAAGATAQLGIKLAAVSGGQIHGNYFFGGGNFVNAAKAAISVASSSASNVSIDGNTFSSFNTAGVTATGGGSLTKMLFGTNAATNNTPKVYDNTWTPTLTLGGSASAGATYAANGQVGTWQREGDWIQAQCYMELTNKGSGTGAVRIAGLPAASQTGTNLDCVGSLLVTNCSTIAGGIASYVQNNTSAVRLYYNDTGTLLSFLDTNIGNTSSFFVNVKYKIDP